VYGNYINAIEIFEGGSAIRTLATADLFATHAVSKYYFEITKLILPFFCSYVTGLSCFLQDSWEPSFLSLWSLPPQTRRTTWKLPSSHSFPSSACCRISLWSRYADLPLSSFAEIDQYPVCFSPHLFTLHLQSRPRSWSPTFSDYSWI
jgi:hypothetical protein